MNASARLIETDDLSGCPFPFFDDTPKDDGTPKTYKIYNDGHHLIATHCWRADGYAPQPVPARKKKADDLTEAQKNIVFNRIMRDIRKENARRKRPPNAEKIDISSTVGSRGERSAFDILFDDLFMQAYNKGLRDRKIYKPMSEYIYSGLLSLFSESEIAEVDIAERVKRKLNNLLHRKKRFRRKAYLNKWNFFVTFTYSINFIAKKLFGGNCAVAFPISIPAAAGGIWACSSVRPKRDVCTFTGLFMCPRGKCSASWKKRPITARRNKKCRHGAKTVFLKKTTEETILRK